MEFLFRDRGSGKRQVKPSQEIALLEDQLAGGESSDDEDFTLPEKGKNSVENSDNASSGTRRVLLHIFCAVGCLAKCNTYYVVEETATTTRFSSGSGFSGNDRFSEKLSAKMDSFSRKGANSGF